MMRFFPGPLRWETLFVKGGTCVGSCGPKKPHHMETPELINTRDRFGRHSNMVLIPVYDIYIVRLQASFPQTPTHERGVGGHVSSIYFLLVMLVAAQLLSGCGFGPQHVPNYLRPLS